MRLSLTHPANQPTRRVPTATAHPPRPPRWTQRNSAVLSPPPRRRTPLVSSRAAWLTLLTLAVTVQPSLTSKAQVDTSQCSYTLVVNELDVSKCPVMLADAQASPYDGAKTQEDWVDVKGGGEARTRSYKTSAPATSSDVGVLKSQVRDLEDRLLEEMVRGRELNSTIARHSTALGKAENQLAAYSANFTIVYRAIMFVQRQLRRQRKINKSLNKKLSNVLLDVVEVNSVLARVPTSTGDGVKAKDKGLHVQSVAKVRSCPGVTDKSATFKDCAAVYESGHRHSGVYYVKPGAAACPVPVWCDMDTTPGGWLLFQRRQDGSVNFTRNWAQYRDGFGHVAGEHWLGNDNLFLLTNQGHYQLRVDLWDFSGNRVHAIYSTFRVAGERDNFQLTVTGYSGSAQDSLYRHNRMGFSTIDHDNDGRRDGHCGAEWEAGWWFNNCWFALLNGLYHNRSDVAYRGIAWNHWKREQLRKSEMKLRPVAKLDD